jgi:hypothetical protein
VVGNRGFRGANWNPLSQRFTHAVTTPWFPGSLIAELEQLLGQRVQVVSPLIRDAVLREAVPL